MKSAVAKWSVIRLRARLRYCFRRAERAKGTCVNLRWLHWYGEWCDAAEEIQRRGLA